MPRSCGSRDDLQRVHQGHSSENRSDRETRQDRDLAGGILGVHGGRLLQKHSSTDKRTWHLNELSAQLCQNRSTHAAPKRTITHPPECTRGARSNSVPASSGESGGSGGGHASSTSSAQRVLNRAAHPTQRRPVGTKHSRHVKLRHSRPFGMRDV